MRAVFTKEGPRQSLRVAKISEFSGFLVDDSIEFQLTAVVLKAFPTVTAGTWNWKKKLEKCSLDLDRLLGKDSPSPIEEGKAAAAPGPPTSEEVRKAKLSLKECLSDLCKSNIRVKLAAALSTLSRVEGKTLSQEQHCCVHHFKANFEVLVSDYLTYYSANQGRELKKFGCGNRISHVRKYYDYYDSHIRGGKKLDSLVKKGDQIKERIKKLNRRGKKEAGAEEKELIEKLEGVEDKEMKLALNMEDSMAYTREMMSSYDALMEELAVEEKKRRAAEELFSHSSLAWASLKQLFG